MKKIAALLFLMVTPWLAFANYEPCEVVSFQLHLRNAVSKTVFATRERTQQENNIKGVIEYLYSAFHDRTVRENDPNIIGPLQSVGFGKDPLQNLNWHLALTTMLIQVHDPVFFPKAEFVNDVILRKIYRDLKPLNVFEVSGLSQAVEHFKKVATNADGTAVVSDVFWKEVDAFNQVINNQVELLREALAFHEFLQWQPMINKLQSGTEQAREQKKGIVIDGDAILKELSRQLEYLDGIEKDFVRTFDTLLESLPHPSVGKSGRIARRKELIFATENGQILQEFLASFAYFRNRINEKIDLLHKLANKPRN